MQKEYKSQLDQQYSLSQEDIDYFRENGFIKLKRSLRDDIWQQGASNPDKKCFPPVDISGPNHPGFGERREASIKILLAISPIPV